MIRDPGLLDRLSALPTEAFTGSVFRATRQNLNPITPSISGGRWMPPGGAGVLYTSLTREGALAEMAFHLGQQTPRPSKPVMVHTLSVTCQRALRLVRVDLRSLGISDSDYAQINYLRSQQIGDVAQFLGCDGLIAPCARWDCENLMLFTDHMSADALLEVVESESVDWLQWARDNKVLRD